MRVEFTRRDVASLHELGVATEPEVFELAGRARPEQCLREWLQRSEEDEEPEDWRKANPREVAELALGLVLIAAGVLGVVAWLVPSWRP